MTSSPSEVDYSEKPRPKGAMGWGYSQLAQRTLSLSTMSQWPPGTARAFYVSPADAVWSKSLNNFTENGFVR